MSKLIAPFGPLDCFVVVDVAEAAQGLLPAPANAVPVTAKPKASKAAAGRLQMERFLKVGRESGADRFSNKDFISLFLQKD
jgi:hypothetical protein